MKGPLAPLCIALLSVGIGACGVGMAVRTTVGAPTSHGRLEGDFDNPSDRRYDSDDDQIRYFGRAADPAERRATIASVRRYYANTIVGDGARACSLMDASLAKGMVETYERPLSPPALRDKPCAVVMSALLRQTHRQIVEEDATLEVTGVRVEGDEAYVLLHVAQTPVASMFLMRERGAWKVGTFIVPPV